MGGIERINNGDFETGDLTAWTKSGGDWSVANHRNHTGSYSVKSDLSAEGTLSQSVDLSDVDELTFYHLGSDEATLYVKIDSIVVYSGHTADYHITWTKRTIDTTSYSGNHMIYFYTNVDGEGQEIFIDDISAVTG